MHQVPCAHRKQCATRVFIRHAEDLNEFGRNSSLHSVLDATSAIKTRNASLPPQPVELSTSSRKPLSPPPPSSTTSIRTYQTALTPPTGAAQVQHSQHHDEISSSNSRNHTGPDHASNTHTNKDLPQPQPAPRTKQPPARPRTIHYRKAGIVFAPPDANREVEIDPDMVIKADPMLCKRAMSAQSIDDRPIQYKSARPIDEWHQYQVELTYTHIFIYSTPALIWPHRRLEYSLTLKRITNFGLLSPLEYTFFVRYPTAGTHHDVIMFSFRALSVTLCREWYMAVYRLLPDHAKPVCSPWCEVHIPMLDIQVRVPLWASQQGTIRYDITLQSVQDAVLAILEKDPTWSKDLASKLGQHEALGLCWSRDNRTEWVYWRNSVHHSHKRIDLVVSPQHIEQTHRLELRQIEHTPSDIILADESTLREPTPVEGYLTRRTTFFGKQLPKAKLKRRRHVYIASFDQFLFVVTHPTEAIPPSLQACYVGSRPDTVCLTPYHQSGRIDQAELRRRHIIMTEASRIIDLTEMAYVRRAFDEEDEAPAAALEAYSDAGSMVPVIANPHTRGKPLLEMVMANGIVLKFESESWETCDAWVQSLTNLSLYWRARLEAERDIHACHHFGDVLNEHYRWTITGDNEAAKDFHGLPDLDTRIWSICWFTQCRDVVKAGVMYFQPRSRGTFSQKIFVLTSNGWLLYFNPFEREPMTCQPVQTAVHDRKGKLDVSDCYIYTPMSSSSPGVGELPCRIFEDGVVASQSSEACLFSLWKPERRRTFSPRRQRLEVYVGRNRRQANASRLQQQHGETFRFLARNRQEKKEWVSAIYVVIEQLLRGQI